MLAPCFFPGRSSLGRDAKDGTHHATYAIGENKQEWKTFPVPQPRTKWIRVHIVGKQPLETDFVYINKKMK